MFALVPPPELLPPLFPLIITLGLLEAKNCVGWHWFKYQDDDGTDNSSKPANKGLYDNSYQLFPYLSFFARELNFNAYDLIQYFDK